MTWLFPVQEKMKLNRTVLLSILLPQLLQGGICFSANKKESFEREGLLENYSLKEEISDVQAPLRMLKISDDEGSQENKKNSADKEESFEHNRLLDDYSPKKEISKAQMPLRMLKISDDEVSQIRKKRKLELEDEEIFYTESKEAEEPLWKGLFNSKTCDLTGYAYDAIILNAIYDICELQKKEELICTNAPKELLKQISILKTDKKYRKKILSLDAITLFRPWLEIRMDMTNLEQKYKNRVIFLMADFACKEVQVVKNYIK